MITQTIVNSYKKGLLEGVFNFSNTTTQVFKVALYTSAATLNANTTVYSATNESTGTGYTAELVATEGLAVVGVANVQTGRVTLL